jgi:hypothetical protein
MAGPMKLTPKQARFVQEYLIDLNAAQAAIRAGYSAKTARVIGHENLTRPEIAAAIEKAMAERAERTGLTADWVVDELRKIAFANMADYMKPGPEGGVVLDFAGLTRDQTAALCQGSIAWPSTVAWRGGPRRAGRGRTRPGRAGGGRAPNRGARRRRPRARDRRRSPPAGARSGSAQYRASA